MRVLIASLQVSHGGSKGHLHPALRVALECKARGHEPLLLPVPGALGEHDRAELEQAGIAFLTPPPLPEGVLKSPQELGALAADPTNTWKAYHSFLVAPLAHQIDGIRQQIEGFAPDILLYDMLVYAAPLAARSLGIPDVGFCAGLKLVAPEAYQHAYREYRARLDQELRRIDARFHHLELLSDHGHLVFTPPGFVEIPENAPAGTVLAGSLPAPVLSTKVPRQGRPYAVLSFGSVMDPSDFPSVTQAIEEVTSAHGLELKIGSRKHYLPLPELLANASIFFHHGGAGTFSEALTQGTPQILIPLATDQPIQAHFLARSGAGLTIPPNEVSRETLEPLVARLLDRADPIHARIREVAREFQASRGAANAVDFLEQIVRKR